ncbi:MAG: DUF4404 family protein [Chitinophagaceae bacterium]|nr:DUF4404 family protein [Anaerolineae bacterium]
MSDQNIRETLERLYVELDLVDPKDETASVKIEQIKTTIQNVLAQSDETHHATLQEQLTEAVVGFEAEHPTMGAAIHAAINILSNSGV